MTTSTNKTINTTSIHNTFSINQTTIISNFSASEGVAMDAVVTALNHMHRGSAILFVARNTAIVAEHMAETVDIEDIMDTYVLIYGVIRQFGRRGLNRLIFN